MLKRAILFFLFALSAWSQCTLTGVSLTLGNPNQITYTGASGSGCPGSAGAAVTADDPIPADMILVGFDGVRGVRGSGASVDAAGNGAFPGWVLSGVGSGRTGSLEVTAVGSGNTAGFSIADAFPSSLRYLLPVPSSIPNPMLTDSGPATCPTSDPASPSSCRQLAWVAPPSGGGTTVAGALVLLEEHTAAGSASLPFTACLSGSYDDYVIRLANLLPATSGTSLLLQVSVDGGSTYLTSPYKWGYQVVNTNGGTSAAGAASATAIQLNDSVDNTASEGGTSGSVNLHLGASAWTSIDGKVTAGVTGIFVSWNSLGAYASTTVPNAFLLKYSSGTIVSGAARCYGIAK